MMATLFLFSCGAEEKPLAAANAKETCNAGTSAVGLAAAPAEPSRRLLVQLKENSGRGFRDAEARAIRRLAGDGRSRGLASERVAEGLLLVQDEQPIEAAELEARLGPDAVEFVEPDHEVFAVGAPETPLAADPLAGKQWAHGIVRSAGAWAVSRGSSSVIVAVVDSGIDPSHPDLVPNLWVNPGEVAGNGIDDDDNGLVDDIHGWNFAANSAAITADDSPSWHGTHVAGTIGAAGGNGIGISGHAQEVRLLTVKFLKSTGSGNSSDAIRGIDYAIRKGAKIISNSWGSRNYSQALAQLVRRAEQAGVLFVAAAGNNGTSNDKTAFYPANYPGSNVISVAASTSTDAMASFSNYGQQMVHVAAPGHKIYSAKNGGTYQTMSGTSMATPLVSGVLATMLAARPDLSFAQIRGALLSTVDQKPAYVGKVMWQGRVNAEAALSLVASLPAGWEAPPPPEAKPYVDPCD